MRTQWQWLTAGVTSLVLSACYSPNAPTGAPCAPGAAASCPTGQICEERAGQGVCVGMGEAIADASTDGTAPGDSGIEDAPTPADDPDGDGIAAPNDNCPDQPNPAQYDEDGDALGDACDPCPLVGRVGSAPADVDLDGDGVGDACDPHPGIPGDRLVTFESFHDGVPTGWTAFGSWSGSPGAVLTNPLAGTALLSPPVPVTATPRFTLSTQVIPSPSSSTNPHGIGAAGPVGPDDGDGVACELLEDLGARELGLVDIATDTIVTSRPYAYQPGSSYTVTLTRADGLFTCAVDGPEGPRGFTRPLGAVAPVSRIGLRSSASAGQFQWLQYITSP